MSGALSVGGCWRLLEPLLAFIEAGYLAVFVGVDDDEQRVAVALEFGGVDRLIGVLAADLDQLLVHISGGSAEKVEAELGVMSRVDHEYLPFGYIGFLSV